GGSRGSSGIREPVEPAIRSSEPSHGESSDPTPLSASRFKRGGNRHKFIARPSGIDKGDGERALQKRDPAVWCPPARRAGRRRRENRLGARNVGRATHQSWIVT